MELNEIVQLFVNNGVAVAVLIYFMIRDYKFITGLTTSIQQLIDTITDLKNTLTDDKK